MDLNSEDTLVWKHSALGGFAAKDVYQILLGLGNSLRWTMIVWRSFIPLSKSFLCWRLFHHRLPIGEVFGKEGFSLPSRCYIS